MRKTRWEVSENVREILNLLLIGAAWIVLTYYWAKVGS